MKLVMLSADQKLAEIKRLYYTTTRKSIDDDLDKALQLLKSMAGEEERERAAVYMDGLSQMRSDWAAKGGKGKPTRGNAKTAIAAETSANGKTCPSATDAGPGKIS